MPDHCSSSRPLDLTKIQAICAFVHRAGEQQYYQSRAITNAFQSWKHRNVLEREMEKWVEENNTGYSAQEIHRLTYVRKYSKYGGGPIDYKIIYCDYSLQTSVFFLQIWETV